MINPYFLMALLYMAVAVLAALDASLTGFNLLAWFNGLRWLRVHFITLGMLTEVIFGVLPRLVAARAPRPAPATRWDIWLALNAGLVVLLAGIPSVNVVLIFTGGALIFVATLLMVGHLAQLRGDGARVGGQSLPFYLSGLTYLLLGITVGTGLWLGWSGPLRIQIPLEVHIHANNWGFLSLVFAGLLIDVIPGLTGRSLASPRTLRVIFWGLTVGALGLVLGPWLGGVLIVTAPGLVLHLASTLALVVFTVRALAAAGRLGRAGTWHIVTSYLWILAPVSVAPLIMLGVPGFPGAGIEATAPQALIYGWVLQMGLALIPYFAGRYVASGHAPALGGTWLSLAAANAGSALIWASIFLVGWQGTLQGVAYALFALALLPVAWQVWVLLRPALLTAEMPPLGAEG